MGSARNLDSRGAISGPKGIKRDSPTIRFFLPFLSLEFPDFVTHFFRKTLFLMDA